MKEVDNYAHLKSLIAKVGAGDRSLDKGPATSVTSGQTPSEWETQQFESQRQQARATLVAKAMVRSEASLDSDSSVIARRSLVGAIASAELTKTLTTGFGTIAYIWLSQLNRVTRVLINDIVDAKKKGPGGYMAHIESMSAMRAKNKNGDASPQELVVKLVASEGSTQFLVSGLVSSINAAFGATLEMYIPVANMSQDAFTSYVNQFVSSVSRRFAPSAMQQTVTKDVPMNKMMPLPSNNIINKPMMSNNNNIKPAMSPLTVQLVPVGPQRVETVRPNKQNYQAQGAANFQTPIKETYKIAGAYDTRGGRARPVDGFVPTSVAAVEGFSASGGGGGAK